MKRTLRSINGTLLNKPRCLGAFRVTEELLNENVKYKDARGIMDMVTEGLSPVSIKHDVKYRSVLVIAEGSVFAAVDKGEPIPLYTPIITKIFDVMSKENYFTVSWNKAEDYQVGNTVFT